MMMFWKSLVLRRQFRRNSIQRPVQLRRENSQARYALEHFEQRILLSAHISALNGADAGKHFIAPSLRHGGNAISAASTGIGNDEVIANHTGITNYTAAHTAATFATVAATDVWTGAQSNAWSNPANWSSGQVPTSATNVVIASGTVIVSSPFTVASLTISGGTLRLPSGLGTCTVSNLSLSGNGTLDLGNNEVVVNYGANPDPKAAILSDLSSGYNGGSWTGPGIDSSAAAVAQGVYGVGYVDGADGIAGASITSGEIEIAYALNGDVNLDGKVDATDFGIYSANFGLTVTGGWEDGDFNDDGNVDATDFALFSPNFGTTANLNPPGIVPSSGTLYTITGTSGAQVLDILSGTVTLSSDLSVLLPNYSLQVENGARVVLASNQTLAQLQLLGTGTLNVETYSITLNYGTGTDPKPTILQYLASGCNATKWNGTGIVSSAAAASRSAYGVGFVDGVDDIAGSSVPPGEIEIAYALNGDVNLDGKVDATDFGTFAVNFGLTATSGWEDGDFNYDGKVDATDFGLFAPDFGQQAAMASVATTPTPVITVTSPSTVLPLESVNVQALESNFGDGTLLNSIIAWNFGDPGSAYNTLRGFSAAHAYAAPGTYTITLTITTPDRRVGTATTTVTVSPDNRQTIYVSTTGSDSNNGLTPATPVQTLAEANSLMTSNTRVLLQAGDMFIFSNQNVLNAAGMQHVYIGSYGTGGQPLLMYNGPPVQGADIGMSSTTQGLVVQGLAFDSIYSDNNDKDPIPSAFFPVGNDIAILNNTFLNLLNDMNMQGSPTNVLVQGNISPYPTGLNAYFAWVQGAEIAFIGNTVADSAGEAIIRVGGASDILIADNNLTKQLDGGDKNVLSIQAGSYAYVYNNTLAIGPTSVGPLGVTTADPNVSFNYAVFDSNVVVDNNFLMQPGADDLMFRNNVIEADGNTGFTINGQETIGAFNWQVQNVWIENNTVTDSGMWGGFLTINNGEAQNVNVLDNLFVNPTFETGFGEGFIVDNNGDLNSFSQIANNVWSVPVAVSTFAQGGYFFVGSNPGNPSGWLTPAEWEATGIPTGDVYENVNLGATYSVEVDGFTAGSSLPTS